MTSSPTGYHTTPALHHMVVRVACATCHSALSFKGVVLPCSLHPGVQWRLSCCFMFSYGVWPL